MIRGSKPVGQTVIRKKPLGSVSILGTISLRFVWRFDRWPKTRVYNRVYPFLRIVPVVQKKLHSFLFFFFKNNQQNGGGGAESEEHGSSASLVYDDATITMCPPSENIQKRRTDKLSARRPRSRANETSRRYIVNTGSDDDVEAALQEAVTSHDRSFSRSLAPSARFAGLRGHSTRMDTVKSVIIHICAICSRFSRIVSHRGVFVFSHC